jgi:putative methyltransferase (TIGR04325 family)
MEIRLKDVLKLLTPPVFIQLAKRLRSDLPLAVHGLSGDFHSWDEALAVSTGYNSELILEKTRTSLMKVKNGEAIYERDSVLFDEIQYTWPVLAGLMWVAARCRGRLNVLDFGGSLGSTYFQNRAFLSGLPEVYWNIVEQPRHVEIGKEWFADDRLRFYKDITGCLADTKPNVVVLSSVLQYLESPYTILGQILGLSCDCVIIDRTPFWAGPTDRLCVQSVPPDIYPAGYPSWIFSKPGFHSSLSKDWQIMVTFETPDKLPGPIEFDYQGLIIVRQNHLP